jgi:hypothetical protein
MRYGTIINLRRVWEVNSGGIREFGRWMNMGHTRDARENRDQKEVHRKDYR